MTSPPATVHVDLDGAREIFIGRGWGYDRSDDPIFDSGFRNFLAFCDEHSITATLFVIADSVRNPQRRQALREAAALGHEIASHTLTHRYLPTLSSAEKRLEIGESRQLLEQEIGVSVGGFRAPGYRIDRESLEILAECGYAYDSSAFPNAKFAAALGTSVDALMAPHEPLPGSSLVEWPMPSPAPFPVPFNPSYSLLLGDWYFRQGVERHRRSGVPLTLLFHLIDVAEPLAADRLKGWASRIMTLSTIAARRKMDRCGAMVREVRTRYRIVSTPAALAEWRAGVAVAGQTRAGASPQS